MRDRFAGQKGWSPKTGSTAVHSFIFLQLLFLCPVHNPFLPILHQPAGKAQLSPFTAFSTKNVSGMCLEGSIIPLMCLKSKMISPFVIKNGWVNHQIIALQKGYLRNTLRLFIIGFSFLLSKWLFTESHVCSIIPNTWRHICTIHNKLHNCQERRGSVMVSMFACHVYARGSKRSHQPALEMCNLSWTKHSNLEKDNSLNHSCVSRSMGCLEYT